MHLGLSQDEFLDCTPRFFDDLVKQYRSKLQHGEFMLAQVTAAVINFSMGRPEKVAKITDFMLTKDCLNRTAPAPKRTRAVIANEVRAVFGLLVV